MGLARILPNVGETKHCRILLLAGVMSSILLYTSLVNPQRRKQVNPIWRFMGLRVCYAFRTPAVLVLATMISLWWMKWVRYVRRMGGHTECQTAVRSQSHILWDGTSFHRVDGGTCSLQILVYGGNMAKAIITFPNSKWNTVVVTDGICPALHIFTHRSKIPIDSKPILVNISVRIVLSRSVYSIQVAKMHFFEGNLSILLLLGIDRHPLQHTTIFALV